MREATLGPLARTAERLTELDPFLTFVAGRPQGDGWVSPGELDAPTLGGWHAELTRRVGDRRVAAAYLGEWITRAGVQAYLLPVLVDARLPMCPIEEVRLHRRGEGFVDAVAVPERPVAVLDGDPAGGADGARVLADRAAMLDAAGDQLAGVVPLLGAIAEAMPVGRPALWAGLADGIAGHGLRAARLADLDRRAAWSDIVAVTDRLAAAAAAAPLRRRPRPFPVTHRGGQEWFHVRVGCCLFYRTVPGADPGGEGYCETCPLRADDARAARLRAQLESPD